MLRVAELFLEAGLPPGVLKLSFAARAASSGEGAGASSGVDKVTFTVHRRWAAASCKARPATYQKGHLWQLGGKIATT